MVYITLHFISRFYLLRPHSWYLPVDSNSGMYWLSPSFSLIASIFVFMFVNCSFVKSLSACNDSTYKEKSLPIICVVLWSEKFSFCMHIPRRMHFSTKQWKDLHKVARGIMGVFTLGRTGTRNGNKWLVWYCVLVPRSASAYVKTP